MDFLKNKSIFSQFCRLEGLVSSEAFLLALWMDNLCLHMVSLLYVHVAVFRFPLFIRHLSFWIGPTLTPLLILITSFFLTNGLSRSLLRDGVDQGKLR